MFDLSTLQYCATVWAVGGRSVFMASAKSQPNPAPTVTYFRVLKCFHICCIAYAGNTKTWASKLDNAPLGHHRKDGEVVTKEVLKLFAVFSKWGTFAREAKSALAKGKASQTYSVHIVKGPDSPNNIVTTLTVTVCITYASSSWSLWPQVSLKSSLFHPYGKSRAGLATAGLLWRGHRWGLANWQETMKRRAYLAVLSCLWTSVPPWVLGSYKIGINCIEFKYKTIGSPGFLSKHGGMLLL